MGITDWLQKKSQEKSASNILDGLRSLVAAVRADVGEAMGDLTQLAAMAEAAERGEKPSEAEVTGQLQQNDRWRNRKMGVLEAQKALYKDLALWSSIQPERSLNEVILPALLSGHLVAPSEPAFGPVIVAAYRVCEAAAKQNGVNLAAHTPPDVLQMVQDAGDLYK